MPNPIKNTDGLVARGGPQIVLERPELAKFLGAIAAEWGDIESMLAEIFNLVTLSERPQPAVNTRSDLAHAIFGCIVSFPVRRDVILSAMRLRFDPDICDEFDQLATTINRGSKPRNTLLHNSWKICDKYPEDLIQIEDEKWVRYTLKDLQHILNISSEIQRTTHNFVFKVSFIPRKDVR